MRILCLVIAVIATAGCQGGDLKSRFEQQYAPPPQTEWQFVRFVETDCPNPRVRAPVDGENAVVLQEKYVEMFSGTELEHVARGDPPGDVAVC